MELKIGNRYGKLTVIGIGRRYDDKWNRYGIVECRCRCDCGKVVDILWKNIASGRSRSCGCGHKGIHRKIEDSDRVDIVVKRKSGESYGDIAKEYGVSKGCIYAICKDEVEDNR